MRARRGTPPRRGRSLRYQVLRTPPLINGFAVQIVSPVNGAVSTDTRPYIYFIPTSELGTPVDVQVEWRTSIPRWNSVLNVWEPTPTHYETLSALSSGDQHSVQPPTELTKYAWYYRFRAGSSASNTWGAWTASDRFVNIQSPVGSATSYIELNVGVPSPVSMGAVAYTDMNIGWKTTDELNAAISYSDFNVGIHPKLGLVAAYTDLNISPFMKLLSTAVYTDLNVDTSQPDPVIWWIRPEEGKEGYVFNIFGHGFGDFQGEYDGKVRLGNLVCAISRWERVPAALRTGTVVVSGKPRATSTTTSFPYVLLSTEQRTAQAGDIIEFDMRWDTPVGSRLDIFPYFTAGGVVAGIGTSQLSDTTGDPWISDQPEAYGEWHHRRFVIPPGSSLIGKTLTNFGVAWYGFAADTPTRTAQVRSFVVRQADETALIWVTGDSQTSRPAMTYVANTGVLDYTEFDQEGHVIHHGQALDPDVITPEHGWIVAVVPPGAVSSMVRVSLEED